MTDRMTFRIKVTREEFESAASDGWVDGQLRGKKGIYAYCELGKEQVYVLQPNDDPKTDYRIFVGCGVYFAKNQERLENGDYALGKFSSAVVIIYC